MLPPKKSQPQASCEDVEVDLKSWRKEKERIPAHCFFSSVFLCEKKNTIRVGMKLAALLKREQKGLESSLPPARRTEN